MSLKYLCSSYVPGVSVFFCLNKEGAEAVMLMFDVVGTEVLVETKRMIIMLSAEGDSDTMGQGQERGWMC